MDKSGSFPSERNGFGRDTGDTTAGKTVIPGSILPVAPLAARILAGFFSRMTVAVEVTQKGTPSVDIPRSAMEWVRLPNKVHHASRQIVHRAGDFDASLLLQVRQDWAATTNLGKSKYNICPGNGIDIRRILTRFLSIKICCRNCWFDSCQESGKVPEYNVVDCALYGSAGRMSQNQHNLGTGNPASKFHAAQHVIVHDVAGDPAYERITYARVKYDFRGNSRIETSKHHRRWVLSSCAGSLLSQIITLRHFARAKALVPFLQFINDLGRSHAVTLLFCKRAT